MNTEPVIKSILDNDLYKFSMQNAVLNYRQNVPVEYEFINRRPDGKFNDAFAKAFQIELGRMSELRLTNDELNFLRNKTPWFGEDYLQYLMNYRFNPSEVNWSIQKNELNLKIISKSWEQSILWEVPLMALISELYFLHCDTDWTYNEQEQIDKLNAKGQKLQDIKFTDFGTRRRRSYDTQYLAVLRLRAFRNFMGTSNVHLAHVLNTRPLGTMAHEWIMGISALEGLRYANKHALKIWMDVYQGNLGTALTDTFGSDAFFRDFDGSLARLFDSVRHDSSCPYKFTDKTVDAYKKLSINPMTKSIIFSDGLTPDEALAIAEYCKDRINCSFGIGTNLTNDFEGSKPLNMVIKLVKCNGIYVVKLSDTPTKSIGNKDAVRVAKWTFFNTPLDAV